ncbi:glycosyltransferase family 2 protein [Pullulanibacillus sp. KACC 23026]|uniref:glycosyltransferase family 2 protein n=1 Tax=Pullulanibacillus sp. KACC 23026 TaxID=3028315 RepID=UPI0023B16549|nr:glycosyltransferase family 2 protein [Pullulanibacillus sp. KACC 23026]WEG11519.1 glycosyltransferase family 2 protein [Pullulanibacillus sp. KACC 23026]
MKPLITIFTPTYNRAYTLPVCYESLKRQTCKEFIWLIIDDGSTDNTRQLVQSWIKEGSIKIVYHYQENQGMHGAHNKAYELIDTELNVCIDSDDYMPDDAVEKITCFWLKNGSETYAGMVGLDATFNGEIIGTKLPEKLEASTHSDLYRKYKVKGDKKLVYRTALTKRTSPYPIYEGEKYCPLAFKYILIDQFGPLLILNDILCHVEYLKDGSSRNIITQYKTNPKGFLLYRVTTMNYAQSFKERFRASIHFISSNLLLKNYKYWMSSPNKLITILATPLGVALFLFIKKTKRVTFMEVNKTNS